ncbi:MAG: MurR/RpiR family transcriptional regulator, partial [Oscillospiraceae bacterium]|nr:MurR/RpiR family transcriptional regulator [Oscillospiraceae bacterium]
MDIDKIRRTLDEISRDSFNAAVESIISAKNIYVIGVRSSFSLASFMSFYLNHIFPNVRNVATTSVSEMFEQIMHIGSGDVLISITFPRYSQRTVKAAKYACENGATVISITDSKDSPIAQFSNTLLLARSDMASFVDSLVAPLSLINALIVAIGLKNKNEVENSLRRLENIWDEYNVYEKSEESK